MVQDIASRRRNGGGHEGQAPSRSVRPREKKTSAPTAAGSVRGNNNARSTSRPLLFAVLLVVVASLVGLCLANARLVTLLEGGDVVFGGDAPSSSRGESDGGRSAAANNGTTYDDPVLAHFRRVGLDLDEESLRLLPTWHDIESILGSSEPVVLGLDRCEAFRESVPPLRRMLGSAGMFNSGTNLVTRLMKENCVIPERFEKYGPKASKEQYGIRWQCPWGKHTPVQFRHDHLAPKNEDNNPDDCLPIVTIRNPFTWMKSMCRIPYSAKWDRSDAGTGGKNMCPHLVYADGPSAGGTRTPVGLEYKFSGHTLSYDSLAHLWNEWYAGYWRDADFPFLMVRLEDLVFRQYETTRIVCDCAGGMIPPEDGFRYIIHSAKTGPAHGKVAERTGMMDAWAKYGKPMATKAGFSDLDYDAAMKFLSRELMEKMGYKCPPSE